MSSIMVRKRVISGVRRGVAMALTALMTGFISLSLARYNKLDILDPNNFVDFVIIVLISLFLSAIIVWVATMTIPGAEKVVSSGDGKS